ncbi:Transcriptional regulator, IclR family [Candidatus Burkholderia verschuerenii]|uniref:Transcriptional regulator, IclR family n=1 Tax=Candidatus Burkholderia verschuerenii TaxID=242163 RepID=A0A0L0MA00_9BURK|nr:helix-turn-helix domain-containing protein [Candidatus Burkholderia verschuerenii]KND59111.1 Transcriptional regulator, IclR family [Candidatus Burkholderia verschuerenii]
MSILDTATTVLRLMAQEQRELSMIDLVDRLDMPKSTASRVLKQMTETGLLERDKKSLAYRPSMLLLELSHLVRSASPLIDMCAQALETLCAQYGHTGYVSVLEGNDVVVLRVRPGSLAFRAMTNPGHRSASWATSTGRALLASESDDVIRARFPLGLRPANAPDSADSPQIDDARAPTRGPATLDALIGEIDVTRSRGSMRSRRTKRFTACARSAARSPIRRAANACRSA